MAVASKNERDAKKFVWFLIGAIGAIIVLMGLHLLFESPKDGRLTNGTPSIVSPK